MKSPDGNGSSKGEGRDGALLLLRGGGSKSRVEADDRASSLPSANALRPDSNLNLGWYRPGAREELGRRVEDAGQRSTERQSAGSGGQAALAGAVPLDLGPGPAPGDAGAFPLGARRPTRSRVTSPEQSGSHGPVPARTAIASLWRRPAAMLAQAAHAAGPRLAVLSGGVLLAAVVTVTVVALEPAGAPRRVVRPGIQSAPNVDQLRLALLTDVTSTIDSLGRSTAAHSLSSAGHRPAARGARASLAQRHAGHPGGRTGGAGSTSVRHVIAPTHAVSAPASDGSRAVANSVRVAPQQVVAVRETAQQAPVQLVHHQSSPAPAGPGGLGSQVGSNCNPKCG
jgi:hypothetical protein